MPGTNAAILLTQLEIDRKSRPHDRFSITFRDMSGEDAAQLLKLVKNWEGQANLTLTTTREVR